MRSKEKSISWLEERWIATLPTGRLLLPANEITLYLGRAGQSFTGQSKSRDIRPLGRATFVLGHRLPNERFGQAWETTARKRQWPIC